MARQQLLVTGKHRALVLTEMTMVVTRARMRRAEADGYEGSIVQVATPGVAKMAVTESGEFRERRRQ